MRRIRNLYKSYHDLSGEKDHILETIKRIKQQIGFMKYASDNQGRVLMQT